MVSGQVAKRARSDQVSPSSARRSSEADQPTLDSPFEFSGLKRGTVLRKSEAVERRVLVNFAREKTLSQRAEGNEADPKFLKDRQRFPSGSRHQSEYSLWTAVTG